jgi:hypothetical protein
MQKKAWKKPELIVLHRGNPEERILSACKTAGVAGYPDNTDTDCIQNGTYCESCHLLVGT